MDSRAEALLYAADRAQHVKEVILPALRAGKTVISDRFVDSSLAYQGVARGLGLEEIYRISEWATSGLVPDLVLYLKVDPHAGLRRVDRDLDRMEREAGDFHEKVGEAYLALAARFPNAFHLERERATREEVLRRLPEARAVPTTPTTRTARSRCRVGRSC